MLEVKNLGVSYSREILEDLNFSIDSGTIIGIVGANGEGKSSLLRILSGYQDATTGEVRWNGKLVRGPQYNLLPGHPDIQLVNQDYQLDLFHTVHENVKHGMSYLPNDVQETFSLELMDLVNLSHLAKEGTTISRLRSTYPAYHISKNKITLTPEMDIDSLLVKVQEKYKDEQTSTIDGLKIDFANEWVHLRRSNTEPIIRIYSEAENETVAENLANKIISDIKEILQLN